MLCIICINSKELGTGYIFHITIINQEVERKKGFRAAKLGVGAVSFTQVSPQVLTLQILQINLATISFFQTQPFKMRFRFKMYRLYAIIVQLLSINYAPSTMLNSIQMDSFVTIATQEIRTRITPTLQMRLKQRF